MRRQMAGRLALGALPSSRSSGNAPERSARPPRNCAHGECHECGPGTDLCGGCGAVGASAGNGLK